ncbi:hypothetical protein BGZ80_003541 [Entomortierella chlamydospora]|uniref:GATA-type domain-containing protein n=1 Tax=Entomortierella chlamydospora TaxID=101097 RepID=A0A9P6SWK1_9FUNG|nr:hypothetical protein BGZ80_003541 [Entomortierella chlamydospora]
MFAHTTTSNAATGSAESWIDNSHDMLLTNQEVLDYDYASFSDDSHSPILSLESFSHQHSPELGAYCFPDFEPIVSSSSSSPSSSALAFQPTLPNTGSTAVTAKPSATETARQAALLHAYLTAQNQIYAAQIQQQQQQQQQQWSLATATLFKNEKAQQEIDASIKDQNESNNLQQQQQRSLVQLDKTQKSDAENLARYLAQMKQVKEESPMEDDDHSYQGMDHADASSGSDSVDAPSSPSSSTSSVMAERSPSPEASNDISSTKNVNNKNSRQLTCYNCNVTQTPLWRRTPDRQHSLCNACGLYYKQYGAHRPLNVRHKLPSVLADSRASAMPYGRQSPPTRGSSPSGPESSASSDSDSDSGHGPCTGYRTLPDLTKMYGDALPRLPGQKTSPPLMIAKQGIECANCSQTQTPLWRKNEAGEPICNACGLYAKLHNRARPVTMRKSKITRRRRDWGGNLAQQAQAQAQAMAQLHAQVQAQSQADAGSSSTEASPEAPKALELNSMPSPVHSSDSEEEQQQQKPVQAQSNNFSQKLSGNLIMDEHKFADMVGQMNAHQMNRFLSILESRCGVLRNRIIANTEGSAQDSSLDSLF